MINQAGLDIIKRYEGFRPEPYLDAVGIPTIGFGSTYDMAGKPVTLDHETITRDQAEEYLMNHLSQHVYGAMGHMISVPLTSNQFSALCSFIYNIGSGRFCSSTMRMLLNRSDYAGAASEFWKWRRAGGVILLGLVRRRQDEQALFLAGESEYDRT